MDSHFGVASNYGFTVNRFRFNNQLGFQKLWYGALKRTAGDNSWVLNRRVAFWCAPDILIAKFLIM